VVNGYEADDARFSACVREATADQVTRALVTMSCNKCGLVDNLSQEEKLAIGEARIHLR